VGNTAIRGLGIIGKLDINNGGQNYALGDVVTFTNVPGGFGFGALANVTGLGPSNSIAHIQFVEVPGQIIGGSGYDYFNLPNVAVSSVGGTGANITVSELVNYGAQIAPINTGLGQIQRIIISSSGAGYEDDTTADLTGSGDGEATATVTILEGTYTYPGRYLNDDGHLSSYNFLQNRDYYQNFSYVVKVRKSVNQYKQAMKELIHPAGMKMFGEYRYIEQNSSSAPENNTETPWRVIFLPKHSKKKQTQSIFRSLHMELQQTQMSIWNIM
jgi:hypothetical protein